MMNFKRVHKGFTLIEMMVYIAILLIVAVASVGFLISLDRFITQYRIETALYRSGTGILEQVMVGIRQADSFDSLNSVIENSAAGVLAVSNDVSDTEFALNAGELHLFIDGEDFGSLTSSEVAVTEFSVFRHPTAVGNLIRVKLGLTATVDGVSKSVTLYGGGVIRGEI